MNSIKGIPSAEAAVYVLTARSKRYTLGKEAMHATHMSSEMKASAAETAVRRIVFAASHTAERKPNTGALTLAVRAPSSSEAACAPPSSSLFLVSETILPRFKNIIRSAISSKYSRSCVETITSLWREMSFKSSATLWQFSSSRFAVGSSANSTGRFAMAARSIAARCTSPKESSAGLRFKRSARPNFSASARKSPHFSGKSRAISSKFSSTVRLSESLPP